MIRIRYVCEFRSGGLQKWRPMIRVSTELRSSLEEFRAKPWDFQFTCVTPLKDLNRFIASFLDPLSLVSGVLTTDEVVFEPRTVQDFLSRYSMQLENPWCFTMEAVGHAAIAQMLEAALSDWVDFLFVPEPRVFAMYADHDEYTTFYAPSYEELKKLVAPLQSAGFRQVENYWREPAEEKRR